MESGHNQRALYRRFLGFMALVCALTVIGIGSGSLPPCKSGGGERGAASRRDSDRHP